MFNVRKSIITMASATVLIAAITACSGNKAREEAAEKLLTEAQASTEAHDYPKAIDLLDTLDIKYRDCLDQRKRGTSVRLTALSSLTRDSLASGEQQLMVVNADVERLSPQFRKIELEGTDGYYVLKSDFNGSEMNRTGIQARVDDEGYLFVIANLSGRKIGLNALKYGDTSTEIGQSIDVEGSEIMSLSQEKTAGFLDAIGSATAPATVQLVGAKGSVPVKLTEAQLTAIKLTREYAQALQRQRRLNITLEKLERQLAKLNDQLANQIEVPEE